MNLQLMSTAKPDTDAGLGVRLAIVETGSVSVNDDVSIFVHLKVIALRVFRTHLGRLLCLVKERQRLGVFSRFYQFLPGGIDVPVDYAVTQMVEYVLSYAVKKTVKLRARIERAANVESYLFLRVLYEIGVDKVDEITNQFLFSLSPIHPLHNLNRNRNN